MIGGFCGLIGASTCGVTSVEVVAGTVKAGYTVGTGFGVGVV